MSKEQQSSHINDQALFITAFSHSNKKGESRKVIPIQPSLEQVEIKDLMKKCEQLISQCRQINVNQCLSSYRQLSSKYRHLRIGVQSQIKKIQSCAKIDIQYLKKLFSNEPKMSYDFINTRLDGEELELQQIKQKVSKCKGKVQYLQEQVG